MSDLKTLEDLTCKHKTRRFWCVQCSLKIKLQREAERWIQYGKNQILEMAEWDDAKKNVLRISGGVRAFKTFFNITEEALNAPNI